MVKGEEPPQKVGDRGKGNNMSEWFTVEQIERDTYAISEYRHWEEPHCYLLLGARRALLIDSGLGVADIGRAFAGLWARGECRQGLGVRDFGAFQLHL